MTLATRTRPVPRVVPLLLRRYLLAAAVGGGVFWLGYDGGTFDATSRAAVGVAVWWTIVLALGLGLWPLARPTGATAAAALLLAALAVAALASAAWGDSAERAFAEFDRVALFLGFFLVAVLAGTRGNCDRWCDGLAAGIAAVGLLALASRLYPDLVAEPDFPPGLEDAERRLSYPLGYWNGLAVLLALGFPLLVRTGLAARSPLVRALAVAVVPALAATIYLTSSRGGLVTAGVAIAVLVAAVGRRIAAAGALLVAGIGSAAAVAVLVQLPLLADDPAAATSRDRVTAALAVLTACVATGIVHGALTSMPPREVRLPRSARWLALLFAVAAVSAAVVAADPSARFEEFTRSPAAGSGFEEEGFTGEHLFSAEGSGRWQFWEAAADAFTSAPLLGRGAGSYEAWWSQHGSFAYAVRDAHSLYLETLAELGILGLLLLVGFIAIPLAGGVRRRLRARSGERDTLGALLAAAAAYVVAAGIDWMWELTAVSVVGITVLGLLAGPATSVEAEVRPAGEATRRPHPGWLRSAGIALVGAGWVVVCAQAVLLLTAVSLRDSREAAAAGRYGEALADARGARSLQPWASTPRLQVALVQEEMGAADDAVASIHEALERDPSDWRLWFVAARLEAKAGQLGDARGSLAKARELNPRSPIFEELSSP